MCQVGFKKRLLSEVAGFAVDARSFRLDWEANGPMVPGLDPMAAQERLQKFQQTFEVGRPSVPPCGWAPSVHSCRDVLRHMNANPQGSKWNFPGSGCKVEHAVVLAG